jgi:transposase InsO family protein
MRGMEAATCADALVAGWISRFGVPAILTTDRGAQFSSVLWSLLCQRLGICHVMMTSYHPQSNGLVERAHRQMKEALKARLAGDKWPDSGFFWVLERRPKTISTYQPPRRPWAHHSLYQGNC